MKNKIIVVFLAIIILFASFFMQNDDEINENLAENIEIKVENAENSDFEEILQEEILEDVYVEIENDLSEEIEILDENTDEIIQNSDKTEEIPVILQENEEIDQEIEVNIENYEPEILSAGISVRCDTIFDNLDKFNANKIGLLPENGVIYSEKAVIFEDGASVFDILIEEMQNNKIHMEYVGTPLQNSVYIEGINNIYEFDCGNLSGWIYSVNGEFPNFSMSNFIVKNGDFIEILYTCDLGEDIR